MAAPDHRHDDFPVPNGERVDNLARVWELISFPEENHGFVERFVAALDVSGFIVRENYIKAERFSPGPSLRISSGFTEGFRSEEEVLAIAQNAERWRSRRGWWGVNHPRSYRREGAYVRKREERTYGVCPSCFQLLPAVGRCDNCEA